MGRKKALFDKNSEKLFKLSRNKVDLYFKCPKCFYLDQKLGIKQPSSYPFTLNNAVDILLKREFDHYRERGIQHPSMSDTFLIPAKHENLEEWRNQFRGVKFEYNGFLLYGGIDELLLNIETGEYHVCDYKATSSKLRPTISLDWQAGYRRQIEFYGWLLNKNELPVSNVGYFVYANGNRELDRFNNELRFDTYLLTHKGSWNWIEPALDEIRGVLEGDSVPEADDKCELCSYSEMVKNI